MSKNFPFTAIVGLDQARRSLIYHAIDPRIGGVLLSGHRGCAKSTLARAFAEVLPSETGEPAPFVEVPLGATEDRLLGSVDPESLVSQGKWVERRGLIEEADGGVLYIDEVNLLPDALADYMLDSAATGEYHLEREGTRRHVRSRYILIGTMNPEEGDLRPQLADRFAHTVSIETDFSAEERVEIVQRRLQFEDDPEGFARSYAASLRSLKERLVQARRQLPQVVLTYEQKLQIAQWAEAYGIEGLRRELAMIRTACCVAVWQGRSEVAETDIKEAWALCVGELPDNEGSSDAGQNASSNGPENRGYGTESTSGAPQRARHDPRELDPVKPEVSENLYSWLNRPNASKKDVNRVTKRRALGGASPRGTQIAWFESLKASCKHGWPRQSRQWCLRYREVKRRPIVWVFLDASRSTGMRQFLGEARDTLMGLLSRVKRYRVAVLMLHGGRLDWLVRRQAPEQSAKVLSEIRAAYGRSELAFALNRLRRAMVNAVPRDEDRALLLTDGLNSPKAGESSREAHRRMRESLTRLTESNIPTAWVHPPAKRGLERRIAELSARLPITRLKASRGG